jgi:hypothetical protein
MLTLIKRAIIDFNDVLPSVLFHDYYITESDIRDPTSIYFSKTFLMKMYH